MTCDDIDDDPDAAFINASHQFPFLHGTHHRMEDRAVLFDSEGDVGMITSNRPERLDSEGRLPVQSVIE